MASHRTFLTAESRNLALPVPLQDFSTPPAHPWKMANKIAHIRKDFVDKPSNDPSKNHAVVFVEDLSIRNMSKSGAN